MHLSKKRAPTKKTPPAKQPVAVKVSDSWEKEKPQEGSVPAVATVT